MFQNCFEFEIDTVGTGSRFHGRSHPWPKEAMPPFLLVIKKKVLRAFLRILGIALPFICLL